ncbi:MAG: hypothetical protein JXJ19_06205 [Elusimicrobia bacterium]|nr:hypothetical protein [Elusimicrobiota bacterium]
MTARISSVKSIGLLSLGFETGADFPLKKWSEKWIRPATIEYTGTAEYHDLPAFDIHIANTFEKEINTVSIPLLLKIQMNALRYSNTKIDLDFAVGEYIIIQNIKTTNTAEVEVAYLTHDAGDTWFQESQEIYSAICTGVDFRPAIEYEFTNNVSMGAFIEIGYISDFGSVSSITNSLKKAYEYGGVTHGAGISLDFDF